MEEGKIIEYKTSFAEKLKRIFCSVFLCRKNIGRDIAITLTAVFFLSGLIIIDARHSSEVKEAEVKGEMFQKELAMLSEDEIFHEVQSVQSQINTENWKNYQSKWYGFEIKYPEKWLIPKSRAATNGAKWEYRLQFRNSEPSEESPYSGFDVVVYNLSRTKELSGTEEFPIIKNASLQAEGKCETIEGHLIETGDYPAEEVYVSPLDDCYGSALFFDYIKGQYIYVVVPALKEGIEMNGDPRVEIVDHFPEFFSVASTLNPITIVRPKPKPKAVINAPRPVSFKKVNGKLVCAKKNDNPSKSKQNKGKHLDMECCLDPDEYPNPHCYYPPEKYGKYLGN